MQVDVSGFDGSVKSWRCLVDEPLEPVELAISTMPKIVSGAGEGDI